VPRGKGKIKVTCRQCGASFEERSWESLLRAVGKDSVPDCLKKKKKVWEKPLTMEERNAIMSKLSQDTGWKVGEKEEKSSWQQLGFVLKYKSPCKSGVHLVN
jgi:CO dehydrogenase/acetyl-CoA synthase alpha subunit